MNSVVLLSGGQDSVVCLAYAIDRGDNVHCVFIDYGQKHIAEKDSAMKVAQMYNVPIEVVEIPRALISSSPLTTHSSTEKFECVSDFKSGVDNTFVPMRNQLFLTIAANRAFALNFSNVIIGSCKEDYEGYPDCREAFLSLLENATKTGTFVDRNFTIEAPLLNTSKKDSVLLGQKLKGCFEALAFSHTSYDGEYPPVNKNHANVLRAKGFADAGIEDPLITRAKKEGFLNV